MAAAAGFICIGDGMKANATPSANQPITSDRRTKDDDAARLECQN
jgi:hypothetical protein